MMYAIENLRKNAPKGAMVEVLSTSIDGVALCEYKGNRFSCRIELLSDVAPVEAIKEVEVTGGFF